MLVECPKVVLIADGAVALGGEQCMACPEPGAHAVVVLGLIVGYACAECADQAQVEVLR